MLMNFYLLGENLPELMNLFGHPDTNLKSQLKLNHVEKNKTNTCLKWANELFEGWINTDTSGLGASLLRALEMFSVEPIMT